MKGEIAYYVKGQGEEWDRSKCWSNAAEKHFLPSFKSDKANPFFPSSHALQKPTAFWVSLDYFIRTHFHSPCRLDKQLPMPNSKLNLWALTAGARAEQRWKDVTLGKHQNSSDKAICSSRKRGQPFHTNSIISPSAPNWKRIIHRGRCTSLCWAVAPVQGLGSCTLSAPIHAAMPSLPKSFLLWPEMLEI